MISFEALSLIGIIGLMVFLVGVPVQSSRIRRSKGRRSI